MTVRYPALGLLMVLLGGCANTHNNLLLVPEIYVTALRPGVDSDSSQELLIDLHLLNPNNFELMIAGIDIELDINGARLVRGLSNDAIEIPAQGSVNLSITTRMTRRDLDRLEQRLAIALHNPGQQTAPQTQSYSVSGWLFLGNDNRINSIPFARSAVFK